MLQLPTPYEMLLQMNGNKKNPTNRIEDIQMKASAGFLPKPTEVTAEPFNVNKVAPSAMPKAKSTAPLQTKQDRPMTQLQSGIDTANQDATVNVLLLDFDADVKNGISTEQLVGGYPELDPSIVAMMADDIKNGAKIADLKRLYPELSGVQTPQNIQQEYDTKKLFNPLAEVGKTIFDAKEYAKENGSFLTSNPLTQAGMGFAGQFVKGVGDLGAGVVGLGDTAQAGVQTMFKGGEIDQYKTRPTGMGEDAFNTFAGATNTLTSVFALPASMLIGTGIELLPENEQKAVGDAMNRAGGELAKMPGIRDRYASLPEDKQMEFKQEMIGSMAGMLFGLKGKKNIVKDPSRFLRENINPVNIVKNFNENVLNVPKSIGKGAKSVATGVGQATAGVTRPIANQIGMSYNRGYASAVGLSPERLKSLSDSPYAKEYIEPELRKIDAGETPIDLQEPANRAVEEIAERLEKGLKEELLKVSEKGTAYKSLYQNKELYDVKPMLSEVEQLFEGSSTTAKKYISSIDKNNFLKVQDIFDGQATVEQLHKARMGIDKLKDQKANSKERGDYEILSGIRKKLDEQLKETPNRKDVDKNFAKSKNAYDYVVENILYKDKSRKGEIKDNIDSIIANINKPNRRKIKDRISKIIPDIGERLEAIREMTPILKAYTGAPGGALSGLVGGAMGAALLSAVPLVGPAMGSLIGGWLGTSGISAVRQRLIMSAVKKQSPSALEKLKEIGEKIEAGDALKKSEKQERDNIMNNIAKSVPQSDAKTRQAVKKMSNEIILIKEGDLEKGIAGDVFVAGSQGVKKGKVTEKGIVTNRTVKEIDSIGKEYKQPDFDLNEYNTKNAMQEREDIRQYGENISPIATRPGDYTQYGKIEKMGFDGGGGTQQRPFAIINGKKYPMGDLKEVYRKGQRFDDMIKDSMTKEPQKTSKLDTMELGVARRTQLSYIEDEIGRKVSGMDKNSKDIIYRLLNNKKLQGEDDLNKTIFALMKEGDIDDEMFDAINKEMDNILKSNNMSSPVGGNTDKMKVKSDTLVSKSDSMSNFKTFDDYFNSLTDQQLVEMKGNANKTILERAKIRKIRDEGNIKQSIKKMANTKSEPNPNKFISDKPIKIPDQVYRGINKDGPTGTAKYGQGLYTASTKKQASVYGDVKSYGREAIPSNPMQFKTELDFNQWEYELSRKLGIDKRELYKDKGVEDYVMELGYDGITVGPKDDMYIIKYTPQKNKPSIGEKLDSLKANK